MADEFKEDINERIKLFKQLESNPKTAPTRTEPVGIKNRIKVPSIFVQNTPEEPGSEKTYRFGSTRTINDSSTQLEEVSRFSKSVDALNVVTSVEVLEKSSSSVDLTQETSQFEVTIQETPKDEDDIKEPDEELTKPRIREVVLKKLPAQDNDDMKVLQYRKKLDELKIKRPSSMVLLNRKDDVKEVAKVYFIDKLNEIKANKRSSQSPKSPTTLFFNFARTNSAPSSKLASPLAAKAFNPAEARTASLEQLEIADSDLTTIDPPKDFQTLADSTVGNEKEAILVQDDTSEELIPAPRQRTMSIEKEHVVENGESFQSLNEDDDNIRNNNDSPSEVTNNCEDPVEITKVPIPAPRKLTAQVQY